MMSNQSLTHDENIELTMAREALRLTLKQLREQKIETSIIEAANDPLFMQDLHDCMRDWADLDRDSLQYMDIEPQYDEEI